MRKMDEILVGREEIGDGCGVETAATAQSSTGAASQPELGSAIRSALPNQYPESAFREEIARKIMAIDVIDHSGGRRRIDTR